MAKWYECEMTCRYSVNIKANSQDEALDWLREHDLKDIENKTSAYRVSWDEEVWGETRSTLGIDITEEEIC